MSQTIFPPRCVPRALHLLLLLPPCRSNMYVQHVPELVGARFEECAFRLVLHGSALLPWLGSAPGALCWHVHTSWNGLSALSTVAQVSGHDCDGCGQC
jgi:hypothetical protein